MKVWSSILVAGLAAAAVARADLIGTFKTITLDGSLGDWSGSDVLYNDAEIGDGDPLNSSYENVYLANNGTDLFIGLDTKGTGGGDILNSYTRNIFVDADANGASGFNGGWMTGGYDYLIQYGSGGTVYSVYSFNGPNQSTWSWSFISTIAYSYNDDAIELSVPLSALGLSGGDTARVLLNVTGAGVTTETWASEFESGAENYTVALVPEPTTAMLLLGGLAALAKLRRARAA